jgi:WhiB family redox-sensing transcriptional regulator
VTVTGWQTEALCAVWPDPDVWFRPELEDLAKAICEICPVRPECLESALARRERWGVWGGLNERERDRLARRAKGA